MTLLDAIRGRHVARHAHRLDEAEVDLLVDAWARAAEGAGFVRTVSTVTGPTVIAPRLVHVVLGPPAVLTVRLEPGQTVTDLRALARRLAPHLGARALRVEPLGVGDHARVTLLAADPLADPLPLSPGPGVLIGRGEDGRCLRVEPADLPHLAVQGATRSGKSRWLYSLLGQLAARRDVEVAGVDPSGLTLRPFVDTRHARRQVRGLADLARIEAVLAELVAEMDRRLAAMPARLDVLPLDVGTPLLAVVLEEWPATLRALDATDPKQGKRVRALVARLLAEGHKAGLRVVLVAQRAEATIVGGAERAQCEGRLSFRVDNAESLRLLHPDSDDLAADHATAPAGIALVGWPGRPTFRLRAPYVASYGEYVAAVTRTTLGFA
ncbi:FtsK/SpoIIIE domain-containing protein [Pseudonocardia sp.]|uniref:FtsK/SpoIIIE domain-containing protein n=1 Tax=Pseudonocardia sp. TaxID=60912 RepID=UPI002612C757|nr:FtsK/SpoIIIE domain-containing protein [Pseudonocardia sp.]